MNTSRLKIFILTNIVDIVQMMQDRKTIDEQVEILQKRTNININKRTYYKYLLQCLGDYYLIATIKHRLDDSELKIRILCKSDETDQEVYSKLISYKALYLQGYKRNITLDEFKNYYKNKNESLISRIK